MNEKDMNPTYNQRIYDLTVRVNNLVAEKSIAEHEAKKWKKYYYMMTLVFIGNYLLPLIIHNGALAFK